MRRLIAILAATPLALLALAGPADAAKPEVIHTSYSSASADVYWSSEGESYLEGGVHAALTSDGPELYVWQSMSNPGGGYIETTVTDAGDYSFTIDRGRLRSARLLADDVTTSTCTYDEEYNQVGDCEVGSVDIDLTWTGQGSISRGNYTERYKNDGFSVNVHVTSTDRSAIVDGAIAGTISFDQFADGMLGTYKQVETKRCAVDACPAPEE